MLGRIRVTSAGKPFARRGTRKRINVTVPAAPLQLTGDVAAPVGWPTPFSANELSFGVELPIL